MKNRKIGHFDVSPIGMGCWAIGGEFWEGDKPLGWGKVSDQESISAIHAGIDHGINFIDTANIYGAGHSEKVIAKAIEGKRDKLIISSKFGFDADEQSKQITGVFSDVDSIRRMCDASLKRLGTDYLDIYFFHINDHEVEKAGEVMDVLEALVDEGKIRSFGWSTDFADRAQYFTQSKNCSAFQFELNVLNDNESMIQVCEQNDIAAVNRGPLAMGLLSGKYNNGNTMSESDIRKISPDWMVYFKDGKPAPELVRRMDSIRDILTSDGRTLTQGALSWLWARSEKNIPIPGFRTVEQISSNAKAMEFGALSASAMGDIEKLLKEV